MASKFSLFFILGTLSLASFGGEFEQKLGAVKCTSSDPGKSDLLLLITKPNPDVLVANLIQTKPNFVEVSTQIYADGTQPHQWNFDSEDPLGFYAGFFLGVHADVFGSPLPYTKSGSFFVNEQQVSGKPRVPNTTVNCDFFPPNS
jgi:hypothetical protein